jgi:hypothetical protein
MKNILLKTCPLALATLLVVRTEACETCAVYSPPELRNLLSGEHDYNAKLNWFTRYSKLDVRLNGTSEEPNMGEEIDSYINQLSLEYVVTPKLKAQISVPYLHRDFKRLQDDVLVSDDESGIGDISVLGKYRICKTEKNDTSFMVTLLAGIKTPTGDSDRLGEADHHEEPGSAHGHDAEESTGPGGESEGHAESAISGHDVALGSGSWDVFGGIKAEWAANNWLADLMAQYYLRTEGDFNYELADDLYVSADVGRILVQESDFAMSLRGGILGEFRDADKQNGVKINHTALDSWYAIVTAAAAWQAFIGELGVDFALDQDSGDATLVPDERFRISAGVFF